MCSQRQGPARTQQARDQHSHQNLKAPASSSGFLASRKQPVVKPLVTGILLRQPQLAHTPPYPRPLQLVFCPCDFLPGVWFCLGGEIRRVSLGDVVGPVLLSFLHILFPKPRTFFAATKMGPSHLSVGSFGYLGFSNFHIYLIFSCFPLLFYAYYMGPALSPTPSLVNMFVLTVNLETLKKWYHHSCFPRILFLKKQHWKFVFTRFYIYICWYFKIEY